MCYYTQRKDFKFVIGNFDDGTIDFIEVQKADGLVTYQYLTYDENGNITNAKFVAPLSGISTDTKIEYKAIQVPADKVRLLKNRHTSLRRVL